MINEKIFKGVNMDKKEKMKKMIISLFDIVIEIQEFQRKMSENKIYDNMSKDNIRKEQQKELVKIVWKGFSKFDEDIKNYPKDKINKNTNTDLEILYIKDKIKNIKQVLSKKESHKISDDKNELDYWNSKLNEMELLNHIANFLRKN